MLKADESYCINRTIIINPTVNSYTFPFRIVSTGFVTADYGFYTERTERPEGYLLFTVSGTGRMTWHDDTVDLLPHSVCLIHCNDYQYYRTTSQNEPWVHYYVHFDGSGLNAYAPYLLDKLRALYPVHWNIFLENFQYLQKNELRNDPLSNSRSCLIISEMLNEMMAARYDLLVPDIADNYNAILPAYEYIRKNYWKQITIDELCNECHMSKYYFLHIFKEAVGEPPYQHLSRYRVDCAKQLLVSTNESVDFISHAVGFPNYSNFITQFKKLTGTTPNEYRNATVRIDYINGRSEINQTNSGSWDSLPLHTGFLFNR